MNFWILSSRLVRTRRDLANNSDKKPKNRRKFAKKIRLKNREIRTNRIKLLLFTFENRRKIKEKSALFGGPYRNSDRQFFYSPQNRGPPPKISPIEQITDRWEPKNSNLQRVTLQKLLHFFCVIEAATHSNVGQHRCRNLNADVLVASLMRSLPKKSRAQRCARANFASRTVEFIADFLRF